MNPGETEKIAYTVECFLNATRMPDGPERVKHEAWLVNWFLVQSGRKVYAIFRKGQVSCHEPGGGVANSFRLVGAKEVRLLWCDGRKISALDEAAYSRNGSLVRLGSAGLLLTLPGGVRSLPGAEAPEQQ